MLTVPSFNMALVKLGIAFKASSILFKHDCKSVLPVINAKESSSTPINSAPELLAE